ncbi:MAG: DUF6198 family protein [Leuconostoc mesenteroides]
MLDRIRKTQFLKFIIYIVGLNVLALGTVLFACGKLGVSALVSVPQVLSLFLPFTLGQATTLIFVILVIFELVLLRKIKFQILAQLLLAFVFGWIVDFYGLKIGIEKITINSLWVQIPVTCLAIIFTAVGIFMMVQANFVLIPPDDVVSVLSVKLNTQFGKMKLRFDLTMICVAIVLSLIFLQRITAIGIGTVLAVLFVGRLINLLEYLFITRRRQLNG